MKGLYFIAILILVTACHNNEKPHFVTVAPKAKLPNYKDQAL